MCYDHAEGIQSHFMTLRKPKKQKKSQNNEYNMLEMKVKKWLKIAFFWFFFSKPIVKIDASACKMQTFAM